MQSSLRPRAFHTEMGFEEEQGGRERGCSCAGGLEGSFVYKVTKLELETLELWTMDPPRVHSHSQSAESNSQ